VKRLVAIFAAVLVAAGVVGGTAAGTDRPESFITICGLLDGDGGFAATLGVVTHYSSGKSTLYCEAHGVPNSSGNVVNWNYAKTGIECNIPGAGSTQTWRNRVGGNGQAQLYCEAWRKEADLFRASAAGGAGLG
jgi:hypothetical protein